MINDESKALRLILSQKWPYREGSTGQILLETCPASDCQWHCYISSKPENDGQWLCHKCQASGNLRDLRELAGVSSSELSSVSIKDAARATHTAEKMPDVEAAHRRLMSEGEDPAAENPAIEYLLDRGVSVDVVERMKLGLVTQEGKRWLCIPYFEKEKLVFCKFRSLPPDEKTFRGSAGREAQLYNIDCLRPDIEDLQIQEGEGDVWAALTNGIIDVVGIPGASLKKTTWVDKLDKLSKAKIYICYDNDEAGVKGARELASRIGFERCYNIVLPKVVNEQPVKDLTDFFKAGGTIEEFLALKAEAKKFDIDGVVSVSTVIEEIKGDILNGVSMRGKYWTAWDKLNKLIAGFNDGDLVGILAPPKIGKTSFAMNVLDHLVRSYEEAGFLYCQEMPPKQLVKKWISCATEVDDANITVDVVNTALAKAANYPADLLFGYTVSRKFADVAETIRQAVRRYGCKFVVFDNLQLLMKPGQDWSQDIAAMANNFKALAMELKIVLMLIIQPKAAGKGEIATSEHAYGSSQIRAAVDYMICLHRESLAPDISEGDLTSMEHLQTDAAFSPVMFVNVDLARFSSGGTCTLWMDGAKSKFYDKEQNTVPVVEIMTNPDDLVEVPFDMV